MKSGYSFDKAGHVHSLDGKPIIGTTTALGIIAKPLTWWASGLACTEFGWLNTKKSTPQERTETASKRLAEIKGMEVDAYIELLEKAYRAHNTKKDDAADKGVDLHAEIENYIKGQMAGTGMLFDDERIQPFVDWTKANVKRFLFSEMCCFSRKLLVGGIADFGYVDMADNNVLGDIKSSKEAYFNQAAQLGGYDIQLSENGGYTETGEKVWTMDKPFKYHAIFAAGAGIGKPFFNTKVESAKTAFAHALGLYKEDLFFPGFDREIKLLVEKPA